MAQRRGQELIDSIPGLDFVIGTDSLELVSRIAEEGLETGVFNQTGLFTGEGLVSSSTMRDDDGISGFVAISRGCSNFCTYCIVPYVRGPLRSRPAEDILKEVNLLYEKGKKEITLLGQNVNSYDYKGVKFSGLLKMMLEETDVPRIRFTTSHPKDFTQDIVDVIASSNRFAHDIHLPLQSGSDDMLLAMNRKYNYKHYREIVRSLKIVDDNISITSDILVGFPGESDTDFQQTVKAIEETVYSGFFSFQYSVRPGTKGSELDNNIPPEIMLKRLQHVIEMGQKAAVNYSQRQIGRTLHVLVEKVDKKDNTLIRGRAENGRVVVFKGAGELIGSIVPVRIEGATTWTLKGAME